MVYGDGGGAVGRLELVGGRHTEMLLSHLLLLCFVCVLVCFWCSNSWGEFCLQTLCRDNGIPIVLAGKKAD